MRVVPGTLLLTAKTTKTIPREETVNNLTRDQERLCTPTMECECGVMYSQTDGGPCHRRCVKCDRLAEAADVDEYDVCVDCRANALDVEYDRERDRKMLESSRDEGDYHGE